MSNNYDIFISYRRIETADKAEHLMTLLSECGFKNNVSFDKENLDGRFDIEILRRLDNCKDFIVVIGEHTLENLNVADTDWYQKLSKCSEDEFSILEDEMHKSGCQLDFVRFEICRAIAKGKNIIPVAASTPSFDFDTLTLPNDISILTKQHAVFYNDSKKFLFKDVLPHILKRLKTKSVKPRKLWRYLAAISLIVLILGAYFLADFVKQNNVFKQCITYSDYKSYLNNKDYSYNKNQCCDSLTEFEKLENGGKAFVENTINKDLNEQKTIDVRWSNKLSLNQLRCLTKVINDMMLIPKGEFVMGDTIFEGINGPAHKVRLSKNFYISKFEVTNYVWNVVMFDKIVIDDAELPICNISWQESHEFTSKLSALTGLDFNLPTEAQWEKAAKAECDFTYSGSNDVSKVAVYVANSNGYCKNVGSKSPNKYELYDMSGNAYEWCFDWVRGKYDVNDTIDPKGFVSDAHGRPCEEYVSKKAIRGGSYRSDIEQLGVTCRDALTPNTKLDDVGFRIVINL